MAETWLGNVITIIDNAPREFSVTETDSLSNTNDPVNMTPYTFIFKENDHGISKVLIDFEVIVTGMLVDQYGFDNSVKRRHQTIAYALYAIRNNPKESGFMLSSDEWESFKEESINFGKELELAILQFIYHVDEHIPGHEIGVRDLVDNFNKEYDQIHSTMEAITAHLSALEREGLVQRGKKAQRYWVERPRMGTNAEPFYLDRRMRKEIEAKLSNRLMIVKKNEKLESRGNMSRNPAADSIFHIMKAGKVYQIGFPRELSDNPGGRDARLYRFALSDPGIPKYTYLSVYLTRTLCAMRILDPNIGNEIGHSYADTFMASRGLYQLIGTNKQEIMLDSNSGPKILFSEVRNDDDLVRRNILQYLSSRYQKLWERDKQVYMLELLSCLGDDIDMIIRNLDYLSQSAMVEWPNPFGYSEIITHPHDYFGIPISIDLKKLPSINRYVESQPELQVSKKMADSINNLQDEYDVFLCHASEDKADFVDDLAAELIRCNIRVWYDKFCLRIGDSLRKSIEDGLRSSRFGIVVLSHSFFNKDWPQKELNALGAQESDGTKKILPIWHNLLKEDVLEYSPLLADLFALESSQGIPKIVSEIMNKLEKA